MAIVSLYRMCVILIMFHTSAAFNIDRSLCLETIIKFMHGQQKCRFNHTHADGLLRDVNVPIGGYCTQNEQCHGSEKSGVCEHHRCVCKTGYILSNFECHEGHLSLNQPCFFSEQCSRSPYTSCLGGICSCIEGYTAEESNYCVPVKVQVGGYCTQNEQCQGSEHSGVCDHGRCVCRTGYIQHNLICHKRNLALNQLCSFSEQCAGSPHTSCLGGKCSCIEGYTAENSSNCVKIKVPVGGYCTKNEQCHGSKNSGVCNHGRCVCRDGYVLFNLECHEGNLVLNQTCSLSEQCTGSPYASCLGGKCSCIEGYTAKNVTSCIQIQTSIFPNSQHKEETNIGNTLGALFGGLLLGVILTTVAAVFTYRRSKTHVNKRDELNVKFSDNDAVVDPNAFQNIHTKDGKQEVSPYSGSEETSMHNNVYEKLRNGQTQDDVQNHLYEQLK
uniref:EGF-like domain-containing protein n=1 Tax=Magallana gigas TaxID=29159 RepID=A0A8W8IY64_MAGGI